MNLRQKVLSGLYWSAGLRFLGQLMTWIITIVVMRLLSPQDYGLMGMAGIFIVFLGMVNELGLGAALIQKREVSDNMIRQMFGLLILVNFCLFLLCILAAPLVASFFEEEKLVPLIRLISVQYIFASFTIIPQSILDRDMRFKEKSIVELISAIAGSLATLLCALNGFGVWSLVWGSLALIFYRTIGFNVIQPSLRLPKFSFKGMRNIISFGGYVTITRILWTLYSQADVIIVGKLLGKHLLGFYSVALTLASLPMQKVSGILNQVAFPAFSTVQTDISQVTSHFLKTLRMMSLIAFPVLWGISSIAPDLVRLMLGEKWSLAIVPLQVLSLVIPVRMMSNLMSPALLGLGHADVNFSNVIRLISILPVSLLIGSHWGIIGVSIAWTTIFPVVFLLNLSRMIKTLGIALREALAVMIKPVFSAIVMYVSVIVIKISMLSVDPIIRLPVCVFAGAVVYVGMILIVNREGYHEAMNLIRVRS
ncbi:MAG TPA: lipopolysaccharide biosynthesis protein [Desulfobacteraceae bacterium]|nr:lipopolysaccharide biosynthesis protein [Desulfobacteraceae bacterium]HPQ27796.1 lipopolysaccharide biosynthesis protein [Desulfobacteraceae bacterium]